MLQIIVNIHPKDEMALKVTRISDALYVASATPPNIPQAWSTSEPLDQYQLWQELQKRGGHRIDLAEAFDDADREWLSR
jgi:hypothetical protein